MERVAVPIWDSNALRARNVRTSDTQTVTELGLAILTMLKATVDAAIAIPTQSQRRSRSSSGRCAPNRPRPANVPTATT